MNQQILDFIKNERVGVLAVEMLDGSPHAATVHIANTENPLQFFFETYKDYRKSESLFGRDKSRASLVVGCNEQNRQTVQLDGEVRLLKNDEEKKLFEEVYLGKFPEKLEKSKDPKVVFFTFIPNWWRFTGWMKPEGKVVISSEDKQ
ncbi:MAG: hypothetical protein A3J48_03245 [Candidatus Doudnabacteria bacterium RIFCSPHIGHO2_02_FULL_46_11]|uniref:Pyridoxamine 5'-phosphate oxidase N-terminal domain-containing protein n=1 Tax=Candidatus Doudnabacteria bacterium RIFCSPHIGHO2_02_FULL_46_11 TaxID=1817832 RepID=A0A1F5P8J1_9BACT|nr:MAG: hypothetical protein A3J48_03245 [Candidatus Doudnabacteria bacterium RIFCSPHIGHO2_02_FULL_46_11]